MGRIIGLTFPKKEVKTKEENKKETKEVKETKNKK